MASKALLGRISDIDIRLLRVFHSVADCGGLSAAELDLNIGRSTISRHIRDLEVRLGVKLCDRGPAGFALTLEGEQILEASTRLLAAINTFHSNVHEIHQRLSGHLAIALFDKAVSNPDAKLSEAIALFDEIAPEVTIEIYKTPVNAIETGVLNGRFDLAIIPTHRHSSSIRYFPMYSEEMYLYCGRGHSLFGRTEPGLTDADIQDKKYVGIGCHSPDMIVSLRLRLSRSADVYDEEAVATLILSGRYVGFLPRHYAENFVKRGEMWQLRGDLYNYRSDHSAIIRRLPKPTRLIESFLECLHRAHERSYDPSGVK